MTNAKHKLTSNTIQLHVYTKGNITIRQEKEGAEQVWLQVGNEKARLVSRETAEHVWSGNTGASVR